MNSSFKGSLCVVSVSVTVPHLIKANSRYILKQAKRERAKGRARGEDVCLDPLGPMGSQAPLRGSFQVGHIVSVSAVSLPTAGPSWSPMGAGP